MSGTLIVAIVGVGLSLASLTWQAASFFLMGSRVQTRLYYGAIDADWSTLLWDIADRRDDGFNPALTSTHIPIIAIEVRNVGRTDVDIISCFLWLTDDMNLHVNSEQRPSLPYRLQHGSRVVWYFADEDVQSVIDAATSPAPYEVMGVAFLANGKQAASPHAPMEKSKKA